MHSINHNNIMNILVVFIIDPDSKDHGANMEPTWVLSVPGGPHVGPMNLAIRGMLFVAHDKTVKPSCKNLEYEKVNDYYFCPKFLP